MGETIEVTAADGHSSGTFLAGNPAAERALILCHDAGGLNHHIRRQANRLAAFGFYVAVPALYDGAEHGREPGWRLEQTSAAAAIPGQPPLASLGTGIRAAMALLGRERIGIIGFGWGATACWHAAALTPGLRAGVAFYGTGIADARQERPLCPMQLHFGAWDRLIPMADVDAIRHAQPDVAIEIYPTAGHLFACDESEAFNMEATESARDNMLAFLQRHL
jgi:carboxymethylenebutenolidase